MYLCQRFARGGGGCVSICGKNFEENEEALFQKKISQIQITPPV
jgi:transcriptional regulator CtsR